MHLSIRATIPGVTEGVFGEMTLGQHVSGEPPMQGAAAECASQGKTWGIGFNAMAEHEMNDSIYRECMVARGWRLSD